MKISLCKLGMAPSRALENVLEAYKTVAFEIKQLTFKMQFVLDTGIVALGVSLINNTQ